MTTEDEILEELKKIHQLMEPKPSPPRPTPKGLWQEFVDFIQKAGVLGLAVGFVMGTYINKVVSALVGDIIMPIPGALVVGGAWQTAVFTLPIGNGMNFLIGDFVGVLIDFLIVAAVIFLIGRYAKRLGMK